MKVARLSLTLAGFLLVPSFFFSAQANEAALKTISLRDFSAVSITGGVHVLLQYRPDKTPSVKMTGKRIGQIQISVTKNTLSIKAPSGKMRNHLPQVMVSLSLPLRSLSIQGIADVTGHELSTKQLDLWVKGPGRIALDGELNTRQIWQTGAGCVDLKGVRSQDLNIKLSELATMRLDGRALLLTGRLTQSSTLEAQRLRTQTVFISTNDNAVARVFPIQNLRAFAGGRSQIFYYHSPKNITENARQSGNVLQMGWRQ
jgi:hypothetical protein